jgi:hypothetical protein
MGSNDQMTLVQALGSPICAATRECEGASTARAENVNRVAKWFPPFRLA